MRMPDALTMQRVLSQKVREIIESPSRSDTEGSEMAIPQYGLEAAKIMRAAMKITTFPASALHPELGAQEARRKEIEHIARMISQAHDKYVSPDTIVSCGHPVRSFSGYYAVPAPADCIPLWKTHLDAATAVYEDRQQS